MDKRGGAACSCEAGFSGPRCEQNLCSDFCLNGGHCSIIEGKPSCDCHESFEGERCDKSSSISKLCQLYCESDLAVLPLQSTSEMESLCV